MLKEHNILIPNLLAFLYIFVCIPLAGIPCWEIDNYAISSLIYEVMCDIEVHISIWFLN